MGCYNFIIITTFIVVIVFIIVTITVIIVVVVVIVNFFLFFRFLNCKSNIRISSFICTYNITIVIFRG